MLSGGQIWGLIFIRRLATIYLAVHNSRSAATRDDRRLPSEVGAGNARATIPRRQPRSAADAKSRIEHRQAEPSETNHSSPGALHAAELIASISQGRDLIAKTRRSEPARTAPTHSAADSCMGGGAASDGFKREKDNPNLVLAERVRCSPERDIKTAMSRTSSILGLTNRLRRQDPRNAESSKGVRR
jgi:hypothetical protein